MTSVLVAMVLLQTGEPSGQATLQPPPAVEAAPDIAPPSARPAVPSDLGEVPTRPQSRRSARLTEEEVDAGRLQRVGLGLALSLPGVGAVTGIIFAAVAHSRSWSPGGADAVGFGFLWFVAASAASLLTPIGAWAGFRAGGGETPLGWSFLGWAMGFVLSGACMAGSLAVTGNARFGMYALAGIVGVAAPLAVLELRHGALVTAGPEPVSAAIIPLNGGAAVALGGRF